MLTNNLLTNEEQYVNTTAKPIKSWKKIVIAGLLVAGTAALACVNMGSAAPQAQSNTTVEQAPIMTLFEKVHSENHDFRAFVTSINMIAETELPEEAIDYSEDEEYMEMTNNALLNLVIPT